MAKWPELAHLNLGNNGIGYNDTLILAGVLSQCQALSHVNLKFNEVGEGVLLKVLGQCTALTHLDLSSTSVIGKDTAEKLAEVLAHCTALAFLNLSKNDIGAAGKKRLRSSWCGPESGLELTWEDSEEEELNWGYRSTDNEEEDVEDEIDEDEDGKVDEHDFGDSRGCGGGGGGRGV
jgi:hypothetical protein